MSGRIFIFLLVFMAAGGCLVAAGQANVNLVGSYTVPSGNFSNVCVSGNYAYVCERDNVRIVDISNPSSPSEVGFYTFANPAIIAGKVKVAGSYAYVLYSQSDVSQPKGIRIINISNPAAPAQAGDYVSANFDIPRDIFVSGNYAYVAANEEGLRIIDISNPAAPAQAGYYIAGSTPANSVTVSGNYAYVTYNNPSFPLESGLKILDISNPAMPVLAGASYSPVQPVAVAVSGNYAYVAEGLFDFFADIKILDKSNPALIVEAGKYDNWSWPPSSAFATGLAVSGNYIYMPTFTAGLRVIDKSNPAYPVEVGYYEYPDSAIGSVSVYGQYAVVQSTSGIMILQYTGGTIAGDKQPNVFITSPRQGDTVSGSVNVVFQANDDAGIAKSLIFVDNVNVATVTASQWMWDTAGTPAGIHKITIITFDTIGQNSVAEIAVRVDSSVQDAPPSVTIQNPKDGDTLNSNPSIEFTATDDVGFSQTVFHIRSVGAIAGQIIDHTYSTNSISPESPWIWPTAGIPSGQYTVTITVYDTASQSASAQITVNLNNGLPVNITGEVRPLEAVIKPSEGKTQAEINYNVQSQSPGENVHVAIKIFNLRGELIKIVLDRDMAVGSDTIAWDGRNFDNDVVASGSYLCYLYVNGKVKDNKKIVVIK